MRIVILFVTLCVLGTGAWAFGLLPNREQAQQMREIALNLPEEVALIARGRPEPKLTLEAERPWVRGDYAYGRVRLRNEGDAIVLASAGTVQCTAFDGQRRRLGDWRASDLGALRPGQEITVGIGIPVGTGRVESLDCRLVQ